ncbi:unnamed protein product, partial [Effrenium voratum]
MCKKGLASLKEEEGVGCAKEAEGPKLSKKETRQILRELRVQVEQALDGGEAVKEACDAVRSAAALVSPQSLEPLVQRLLAASPREGLRLCVDLLSLEEVSFGEALLSVLVSVLVEVASLEIAEQVMLHAVATKRAKMRTLQPVLDAFCSAGSLTRLQETFSSVVRPWVKADRLRLNGRAIHTLLRGFGGRPQEQEAVLELLAEMELELPGEWLDRIQQVREGGIVADFVLCAEVAASPAALEPPPPASLENCGALLRPATLERLEAVMTGGITCFVDGPNVGYRGAVQRASSEGPRLKGGPRNFQREEVVENLHAPYFRHDQIAAALREMRSLGERPLVVLPERYAFAQVLGVGPKAPLHPLVSQWMLEKSLFIVGDDEPDDAVWLYGLLRHGGICVTRDKALNHRAQIWGMRFNAGQRQVELERSWRRWSAQHLRWFAISWADCDHFSQDVSIRLEPPKLPVEIHRTGDVWYLPETGGARWLRLQLKSDSDFDSTRIAEMSIPGGPEAAELEQRGELSELTRLYGVRLAEIPERGLGYCAVRRIKRGEALLFDRARCSALVGEEDVAQLAAQVGEGSEVMALTHGAGSDDVLGKIQNNVFHATRDVEWCALFLGVARLNHSCLPNAFVDCSRSCAVVRALTEIQEAAEVLISYVPVSDALAARSEQLRHKGFDCDCARCREEAQGVLLCACGAWLPEEAAACPCGADAATLHSASAALSQANEFMQSPEAAKTDTRQLIAKLTKLKEECYSNGPLPQSADTVTFLNNLSNLHFFSAQHLAGPQREEALVAFYECKRQLMASYEALHGGSAQR